MLYKRNKRKFRMKPILLLANGISDGIDLLRFHFGFGEIPKTLKNNVDRHPHSIFLK